MLLPRGKESISELLNVRKGLSPPVTSSDPVTLMTRIKLFWGKNTKLAQLQRVSVCVMEKPTICHERLSFSIEIDFSVAQYFILYVHYNTA